MTPLAEAKAALRKAMLERRAFEAAQMPKAGEALTCRFPDALFPQPGAVVSGYAPIRDEIEPGGVLALCAQRGARLALPVTGKGDAPLTFRAWSFGEPLVLGAFGVREPGGGAEAVDPDILLVPCLAWDHEGGRLGYGGGYYDRTLAALRARKSVTAVGLAFEVQRVDAAPMNDDDERLDWIVTESAAYEAVDAR